MAGKKLDEQMEKTIRNNYRRLTGCLIDRKMTITNHGKYHLRADCFHDHRY